MLIGCLPFYHFFFFFGFLSLFRKKNIIKIVTAMIIKIIIKVKLMSGTHSPIISSEGNKLIIGIANVVFVVVTRCSPSPQIAISVQSLVHLSSPITEFSDTLQCPSPQISTGGSSMHSPNSPSCEEQTSPLGQVFGKKFVLVSGQHSAVQTTFCTAWAMH